MKLPRPLVPATFVSRPNRFAAELRVEGRRVYAHVPNSGRMTELLTPSNPMYAVPARDPDGRKTTHDLLLVEYNGTLVTVDSRLPSILLAEAIQAGRLDDFAGATAFKTEVSYGHSRLDLMLTVSGEDCYIETKSVNLVEGGVALFPDAPTTRGVKHLGTLVEAVRRGNRAAIVFVVQRSDARRLKPFDEADPDFGRALRDARAAGVAVHAYVSRITTEEMWISNEIPVDLGAA